MADGYASIIFSNGSYYFVYDSKKYLDYVRLFGTDCSSWGGDQNNKTNIKGEVK